MFAYRAGRAPRYYVVRPVSSDRARFENTAPSSIG
jgi:hypothetical protein